MTMLNFKRISTSVPKRATLFVAQAASANFVGQRKVVASVVV